MVRAGVSGFVPNVKHSDAMECSSLGELLATTLVLESDNLGEGFFSVTVSLVGCSNGFPMDIVSLRSVMWHSLW